MNEAYPVYVLSVVCEATTVVDKDVDLEAIASGQ